MTNGEQKGEETDICICFLLIKIHRKDEQKSNRNCCLMRKEQEGGNGGRSKNSECNFLWILLVKNVLTIIKKCLKYSREKKVTYEHVT